MRKVYLSLMIFASLMIIEVDLFAQTATPPSNYNTSDGSETDPYLIGSSNNLYWLSQNPNEWDKNYKQTTNINASGTTGWDGGAGFSPIGNNSTDFTGSYNGQNYTIDGLTIIRNSGSSIALFGTIEDAIIENLGITSINITGDVAVGGLVGTSGVGSTIKN